MQPTETRMDSMKHHFISLRETDLKSKQIFLEDGKTEASSKSERYSKWNLINDARSTHSSSGKLDVFNLIVNYFRHPCMCKLFFVFFFHKNVAQRECKNIGIPV